MTIKEQYIHHLDKAWSAVYNALIIRGLEHDWCQTGWYYHKDFLSTHLAPACEYRVAVTPIPPEIAMLIEQEEMLHNILRSLKGLA